MAKRTALAATLLLLLAGSGALLFAPAEKPEAPDAASPPAALSVAEPAPGPAPAPVRASRGLRGVVRNARGPVANATVELWPHRSELALKCACTDGCEERLVSASCEEGLAALSARARQAGTFLAATQTAEDGRFAFEPPGAGDFGLWVQHPREGAAWKPGLDPGSPMEVELRLDGAQWLSGTVSRDGERGALAAGARVDVWVPSVPRWLTTTASSDGTFQVGPLPALPLVAVTTQPGLLGEAQGFDGPETDAELSLYAPARLAVKVEQRGVAAPGVEVTASRSHHETFTGRTGADGWLFFEGVRRGHWELSAHDRGWIARAEHELGIEPPAVLKLSEALKLEVEVRAENGEPLAGAEVAAFGSLDSEHWEQTTDTRGRARFDALIAGEMPRVTVGLEGYVDFDSTEGAKPSPALRGAHTLQVVLKRASVVTGRVVDEKNQPVPQAELELWRKQPFEQSLESASDEAGRFRFDRAGAGSWKLRLIDERFARVELSVEAPSSEVVLVAQPPASLHGRVLTATGEPVPQARVYLRAKDGAAKDAPVEQAVTDTLGAWEMESVPLGAHTLSADLVVEEPPDYRSSEPVELTLVSGSQTRELRLRPQQRLAGIVQFEDGDPVTAGSVRAVLDEPGRRRVRKSTAVGPDGRFEFAAVEPGRWVLEANGERKSEVTAEAGNTSVKLTLPSHRHLEGQVLDEERRPIAKFKVGDAPFEAGRYVLHLQANTVLRFSADGYTPVTRWVPPGGPSRLLLDDVVLTRGRTLTVKVKDERGAPVAQAEVTATPMGRQPSGSTLAAVTGRTNDAGVCVLQGISSAHDALTVRHPNHVAAKVALAPLEQEKTVQLSLSVKLFLRVFTRDGKALRAAPVAARCGRFQHFSASHLLEQPLPLPRGPCEVWALLDDNLAGPVSVRLENEALTVELREGNQGARLTVPVAGLGAMGGLGAPDEPAPTHLSSAMATALHLSAERRARCDARGCVFPPQPPGSYRVWVLKTGATSVFASTVVTLAPGARTLELPESAFQPLAQ